MRPSACSPADQQAAEPHWPQAACWESSCDGAGACGAPCSSGACSGGAYCQLAPGSQLPLYAQAQQVATADHIQATSVIYICDPRTEEECLERSLLGLPSSQTQVVRGIVPEASLLFLFNVSSATAHFPAGPCHSRPCPPYCVCLVHLSLTPPLVS